MDQRQVQQIKKQRHSAKDEEGTRQQGKFDTSLLTPALSSLRGRRGRRTGRFRRAALLSHRLRLNGFTLQESEQEDARAEGHQQEKERGRIFRAVYKREQGEEKVFLHDPW